MLVIYPYKKTSGGARLLARKLGAKLRYKPTKGTVINWGNSNIIPIPMINSPLAVSVASNKLTTLQTLAQANVRTVPWTTERTIAQNWLTDGSRVVLRSLLRASEGRGITIVEPTSTIGNANLYTKYIPKKKEFRVHVVGNEVIDIQEKRKRVGTESSLVRSHGNYVFCREHIEEPSELRPLCIKAVQALGLDFGGVDAIWNEKQDKCYILEINTAPGLTDTTAEIYSTALKKFFLQRSS